ncbi:hypothetical protein QR680_012245 [Steinernema hermaphroditum]|uniref:Major facilitator superfamily (MFS) profile domain-containing protein n=1 Tax=Steinernema hermaphroditum TaxID=289476 RepID=A0AA39I3X4_9BILA|nr:hypothetical protein QR680_012245 [Steinernema hermaphroditum]
MEAFRQQFSFDSLSFRPSGFRSCHQTRHIILFLSTLCLSLLLSDCLVFNILIICINEESVDLRTPNETEEATVSNFTSAQIGWLLSASGLGSLIGEFVVAKVLPLLGIRYLLTIFGVATATATALTPIMTTLGFGALFVARLVQSLPLASTRFLIASVSSKWAPPKQKATFLRVLYCSVHIAFLYSMPMSAFLSQTSVGWQTVYYVHAGCTFLAFGLFFGLFRNSPMDHKWMSRKELDLIQKNVPGDEKEPILLGSLVRTPAVWGILCSSFGAIVGYTYGPTYLTKVLDFDVRKTGICLATPHLLCLFLTLFMNSISYSIPALSPRTKTILFALVSQGSLVISLLSVAFLSLPVGKFVFFITAIVSYPFFFAGPIRSAQMIEESFFTSCGFVLHSIVSVLLPGVVATYAPDHTQEQWTSILVGVCVIVTFGTILFVIVADDEQTTKFRRARSAVTPVRRL